MNQAGELVPQNESTPRLPDRLARVPAFPPVAARLLGMLSREGVSLGEVAEWIATDPIFSSRILQYANSVEFGGAQPVTSLKHALIMLGFDRTRKLALSLAMTAYVQTALKARQLRRCWRHTIACALIADAMARACGQFEEQAYTAGILHDVGRLGLLVAYPFEYEETIRFAAERSLDMLDYERERFGVDHAEAGRMLVERWKLPDPFPLIAGRHHDRTEGLELDLLGVVSRACRAADALGFDVTQPLRPQTLEEIFEGLPAAAVRRLLSESDKWRDQIENRIASYESTSTEPAEEAVPEGNIEEVEPTEGFGVDIPTVAAVEPETVPTGVAMWKLAAAVAAAAAALAAWMTR
jgi:HD-like signal output (HDOD) protein